MTYGGKEAGGRTDLADEHRVSSISSEGGRILTPKLTLLGVLHRQHHSIKTIFTLEMSSDASKCAVLVHDDGHHDGGLGRGGGSETDGWTAAAPVVGTGAMATRGAGCVQSLMSVVEHLAEPARTDNRRLCARARLGTCHEHDASTSAAPPRRARRPPPRQRGKMRNCPERERGNPMFPFLPLVYNRRAPRERGAEARPQS